MDNKNEFKYTYSSNKQEKIKEIREKYMKKNEDSFDYLCKLDESVRNKSTILSLVMGIIGALIFGFGMSLILTDLGINMGINDNKICLIFAIVIGIIGIIVCIFAYPLYRFIERKEREKIAPKVIKITDELLKK